MPIPATADADTYHALRGNEAWADLAEADKTAALYRAQDYMDCTYTFRDYSDEDAETIAEYDALIERANIILALEMLSPVSATQEPQIKRKREKLDGIVEEETEYAGTVGDSYPSVTGLLAPVLKHSRVAGIQTIKLVR